MPDQTMYLRSREYTQRIAIGTAGNANGLSEYIGWAVPGTDTGKPGWRIQKLEYDSNKRVISIKWGSSSAEFMHAWDNRNTIAYG